MLFQSLITALSLPLAFALAPPVSDVSVRNLGLLGYNLDAGFTFCTRITADVKVATGGSVFGIGGSSYATIKSNTCVCVKAEADVGFGQFSTGVEVYVSDGQTFSGAAAANIANSVSSSSTRQVSIH
jgi:hypothetical protein